MIEDLHLLRQVAEVLELVADGQPVRARQGRDRGRHAELGREELGFVDSALDAEHGEKPVHFPVRAHRGVTKVGAVILNTGQADELSLSRTNGRFSIGNYVTALICRMVEERLSAYGMPLVPTFKPS